MKKTLLTLTACGLLAMAMPALAQVFPAEEAATRGAAGAREIALVYRSDGPAPVRMPSPKDPLEGPAGFASHDAATLGRGAAIPNTGGSAASTPQEQADRNIRQLIRKLG